MRRRQFARMVGAGIAGLGITSTVAARGEGELPNENVSTSRIHPFPQWESTADAGDWIVHYIGWVDAEGDESTKEAVQRWLDTVEMRAWIDGEEIQNVNDYWGEIYENDNERHIVNWEYATPPKSVGTHSFAIEFSYPDGFYDDGEEVRAPGTVNPFSSEYEVSADR